MGFLKSVKELIHNITTNDHYAQYDDSATPSASGSPLNRTRNSSQINLAQNTSTTSLTANSRGPYKPGLRSKLNNDSQIELRDYSQGRALVDVGELWDKLDSWLDREFPELGDDLEDGATGNDLNAFEADLNIVLPYDFRESYQIHDGQVTMGKIRGLIYSYQLLDLESIAAETNIWRKMLHLQDSQKLEVSTSKQSSCPHDFVQNVYYNPNWIPFVKDNVGNNIGLDLAPGPKGQVGQIILFGREFDVKYVVANSFSEFLDDLSKQLEDGRFEITEDEDLVYVGTQGNTANYFDVLKNQSIQRARKLDPNYKVEEPRKVKDSDLVLPKRAAKDTKKAIKTELKAPVLPEENLISPALETGKDTLEPVSEITPHRNISKELVANNDSFVIEEDDEEEKEDLSKENEEVKKEEPISTVSDEPVTERAATETAEEAATETAEKPAEEVQLVEEKPEEPIDNETTKIPATEVVELDVEAVDEESEDKEGEEAAEVTEEVGEEVEKGEGESSPKPAAKKNKSKKKNKRKN